MHQTGSRVVPAPSKRLLQLGTAFTAYRRAYPRRRFPRALRARAVAALEAGATVSAVCRVCKLSSTQLQRWRHVVSSSAAAVPSARVLSVVEAEPSRASSALEDEVELHIGSWQVRLRRAVD